MSGALLTLIRLAFRRSSPSQTLSWASLRDFRSRSAARRKTSTGGSEAPLPPDPPPGNSERRVRSRPLLAAVALFGIVAAAAGGELAGGAIRALGIVTLLGVATAAVAAGRRRSPLPALVRLEERHLLARDAGVAVVAVAGQRLLVGFGTSGVALLSRLRGGEGGEP